MRACFAVVVAGLMLGAATGEGQATASAGAGVSTASSAGPAAAIDHLALYVSDLKASVTFYKDVFGFKEVPAPFPIARWLVGSNGLALHMVSGRTEPVKRTKWEHFAVACGSMDAMTAALDAKGIAWSSMEGKKVPQVRPDGVKQIFVQDPDGYWIEINDALKAR